MTTATPASTPAAPHGQPVLRLEAWSRPSATSSASPASTWTCYPGEVLAVIGDNGAGKSTLIKCLSGAMTPDAGTITVDGQQVTFRSTQEARARGHRDRLPDPRRRARARHREQPVPRPRETPPGILGSVFRMLDTGAMKRKSKQFIDELGIRTLQNINQSVETLSGGQRQVVAVARAGAFGSKVVILDEPTAALGVRETGQVLRLIRDLRERGLGVILISHNMPNVFEVADRIHIQRLGRGVGRDHSADPHSRGSRRHHDRGDHPGGGDQVRGRRRRFDSGAPARPRTLSSERRRRMSVLDTFAVPGRVAVVTGGNRGLGRAFALALAEAGADVAVLARNDLASATVVGQLADNGVRAAAFSADVRGPRGRRARGRADRRGLRPASTSWSTTPGRASTARPWR